MIKILKDDKWVDGVPVDGDKVRKYDSAGGYVGCIYYTEDVPTPNKIVVTSHSKRALVDIGGTTNVTVEFQDYDGNVLPLSDSFAVPVGRVGAGNYRTLMMTFVDGVCSKTVQWNDSGEFEITGDMVNMHLEDKLDFDGFNISVME